MEMKSPIVSDYPLLTLFSVVILYAGNKETLGEKMPESSGKFMLVETPDDKKPSEYLVVEKPNGRKSLIELEKQNNYEEQRKKEIGSKCFP